MKYSIPLQGMKILLSLLTKSREPTIDSLSNEGSKITHCEGNIEIQGVHFTYPTRPEAPIFKGLSLKINSGETVALVGSSKDRIIKTYV